MPRVPKYKIKSRTIDKEAEPLEHIELAAKEAARYLRAVVNGEELKPSWPRIDSAKYMLDHAIGKAKSKIELPAGSANFYFQMILTANKSDGESPKIEEAKVLEERNPNLATTALSVTTQS